MIFAPLHKRLGVGATGFLVFVMSGLVHDLVISVPARGGYGLPTTYFVVQGVGAALERSRFGKRLGLRRGLRGWLFTAALLPVPPSGFFILRLCCVSYFLLCRRCTHYDDII